MKLTLNKDGVTYIFEGETAEVTQAVWQMFPSLLMPMYFYTVPTVYTFPEYKVTDNIGTTWGNAADKGTSYKVYGD
jgi:hypothetical protein